MPTRKLQILGVTGYSSYCDIEVLGGTVSLLYSLVPEDIFKNYSDYVLVEQTKPSIFGTSLGGRIFSATYWLEKKVHPE